MVVKGSFLKNLSRSQIIKQCLFLLKNGPFNMLWKADSLGEQSEWRALQ